METGFVCAMPSGRALLFSAGKEHTMENRIAAVSILVEEPASVEALNALLHDYAQHILGRMGIPYRARGLNIICIALDAPEDKIRALTEELSGVGGVSAQATYPNV